MDGVSPSSLNWEEMVSIGSSDSVPHSVSRGAVGDP